MSSSPHHQEPLPASAPAPPRRGLGCTLLWCWLWTAFSVLYLAAVLIVERGFDEAAPLSHLLTYAPQPLLLLPLAPALFFSLIFWRRRLTLLNLVLVTIFVAVLMPPSVPLHRPRHAGPDRIRIVTWNVHEEWDHVPALREALGKLGPDIVCLQEARRAAFGEVLSGGAIAHTHEVTTVTRGKLLGQRAIRLGAYPNFRWGLETDVELPQGRLKLLNVHFLAAFSAATLRQNRHDLPDFIEHGEEARDLERDAVLQWLKETAGPRVVAGDFNSPPNCSIYRALAAVAVDAFGATGLGWGWTFRRDYPTLRIDHIFCGEGVTPVAAFTVDGKVSDHRMMAADVVVGESPSGGLTPQGSVPKNGDGVSPLRGQTPEEQTPSPSRSKPLPTDVR